MAITSIILIFVSMWNFVNIIDISSDQIIETIPTTVELLNQLKEVNDLIVEKDLLILNYQNEISKLTITCQDLKEKLELTQHSLNMASEALNNLTEEGKVDNSFDYDEE